ncbi:unnamed protein product [Moneuplotes crassus]|uniref:Uncharacterized protein n=1 Tax=Euplotes crassus TaxID=5936 RepID=A0AAD1XVQ6_EUPCR|nr:unnamed protein product [Moneuplotes crassus]
MEDTNSTDPTDQRKDNSSKEGLSFSEVDSSNESGQSESSFSLHTESNTGTNDPNTEGDAKNSLIVKEEDLVNSHDLEEVIQSDKTQKVDSPSPERFQAKEGEASESSFNISGESSAQDSILKDELEKNMVTKEETLEAENTHSTLEFSDDNSDQLSISNKMSDLGSVTTDSKVKSTSENFTLKSDVKNTIIEEEAKNKVSDYAMSIDDDIKSEYTKEEIQDIVKALREEFHHAMEELEEAKSFPETLLRPDGHPCCNLHVVIEQIAKYYDLMVNSDAYFKKEIGVMKGGKEGEGQMQSLICKVVNNYRYLYNIAKLIKLDQEIIDRYDTRMDQYDQKTILLTWKDIDCNKIQGGASTVLNAIKLNDECNTEVTLWNCWVIKDHHLEDYELEENFTYASINFRKFDKEGYQAFERINMKLLSIFTPLIENKFTISGATISLNQILEILETEGEFEILKFYNCNICCTPVEDSTPPVVHPQLKIKVFECNTNTLKSEDGLTNASPEEKTQFLNCLNSTFANIPQLEKVEVMMCTGLDDTELRIC